MNSNAVMATAWREFVRGFKIGLRPSLLSLLVAFVLLVLFAGLGEWALRRNLHLALSDKWLHRPEEANMDLARAKAVYEFKPSTRLPVIVLGSSGSREAYPVDEVNASKRLTEALGRPTAYLNLAGVQLYPLDLLMYYESLHLTQSPAVITVGISPLILMHMSDHFIEFSSSRSRFFLSDMTPHADQILEALGFEPASPIRLVQMRGRIGPMIKLKLTEFFHSGDLIAHGLNPLKYGEMTHWTPDEFSEENYQRWFRHNFVGFEHAPDVSIRAYRALAKLTKSRGQHLLLAEEPAHPRLDALQPELNERYRQTLAELLQELQVPYVDLQEEAQLTPEAFHDFRHIYKEKDKFFEAFVREVIKNVQRP